MSVCYTENCPRHCHYTLGRIADRLDEPDFLSINNPPTIDAPLIRHAYFINKRVGAVSNEMAKLISYIGRIEQRPNFQTAIILLPLAGHSCLT